MSEQAWCFLGLLVGLSVLALIAKAAFSAPASGLFRGYRDVRLEWRRTRDKGEKALLIGSVFCQLARGGIFVLLATIVGAVFSLALSVCGTSPESMRVGKQMLDSILEFLRDLLGMPARTTTSSAS